MNFSTKEKEELLKITNEFKKHTEIDPNLKIPNVKRIDPSNHNWIFELNDIEGIVFKMSLSKDGLKDRLESIAYGQDVCQKHNLNLLKIPEVNIISNDNLYAERKYNLIKNPNEYGKIYSKETLAKIYEQLAIFICKTGTSDLTHQNFEFLADGSDICLFDLEDINPSDPSIGLRTFLTGCAGMNLGPEIFNQTKATIKANAPDTYKKLWPS